MPVALPREGAAGNRVGIMVARLPLSAESAEERLRLIAAQTREARVAAREQGTLELMRGPLGARIMNRIARHQHLVAAFVTNVPGPPERLGLAGAGIETIWPVAVIAGNVRVGVAAVSYAGQLCCGIHFDADHIDGAAIAAAMRQEFEALT